MTSSPHFIPQSDPPLPPWQTLPTMYNLPSDNPEEPALPDDFHFLQPLLWMMPKIYLLESHVLGI